MTPFSSARRPRGFTLIEILVVISIICLLMALAVPALVSVLQGNKLSTAGQNLTSRLSQAQQLASAQNMPVEVRFYQFQDNTQVVSGAAYGAYQFILIHTKIANGVTSEYGEPLSSPYFLDNGVFITTGTIQVNGSNGDSSPLLDNSGGSQFTDNGSGPGAVPQQIQRGSTTGNAKYVAIRILPNGEVKKVLPGGTDTSAGVGTAYKLQTLALNQAYFTIVSQKDMTANGTVYNYYSIQLDPYTGHVRTYQPSIQ